MWIIPIFFSAKVWQTLLCSDASNVSHALVRSSSDGVTWTVEMNVPITGVWFGFPKGIIEKPNLDVLTFIFNAYSVGGGMSRYEMVTYANSGAGFVAQPAYKYFSQSLDPIAGINLGGNRYLVGGNLNTAESVSGRQWNIQLTNDNGLTWANSDAFQYPTSTSNNSSLVDLISLVDDSVLALGSSPGSGTDNYPRLILRRGVPNITGVINWQTIDDYKDNASSLEVPAFIFQTKTGAVISGNSSSNPTPPKWIVRRATGNLSTWNTVDTFSDPTYTNILHGITQDSNGRIYTIGRKAYSSSQIILRISDDDGLTWQTKKVWDVNGNPFIVSSPAGLFMVRVENSTITIERSLNQGDTWEVLKSSVIGYLKKIKADQDNLFLIGELTYNSKVATVLRFNLASNQIFELDSDLKSKIGIGKNYFNCSNETWCLLSSTPNGRALENRALIRRLSQ